jgi:hypothetical protein
MLADSVRAVTPVDAAAPCVVVTVAALGVSCVYAAISTPLILKAAVLLISVGATPVTVVFRPVDSPPAVVELTVKNLSTLHILDYVYITN